MPNIRIGRNILLVIKDFNPNKMATPLSQILSKLGNTTFAIYEGISKKDIPNLTDVTNVNLFSSSEENWKSYSDSGFVDHMISSNNIGAIVCGLSSPMRLEGVFARAATRLGIPLIVLDDTWGSISRFHSDINVGLIVTLDSLAESITREHFPNANTVIAGNIGVPSNLKDIYDPQVTEQMEKLNKEFGMTVVFSESGPDAVEEQITLLLESLKATSKSFCLIPRFHPKWGCYHEKWLSALSPIEDQIVKIDSRKTDPIVACADMTISGFSTLLVTSALCGKKAVSLNTPKTMEYLKEVTSLGTFPLVGLGVSTEISEPTDLSKIPTPSGNSLESLLPYDPMVAAKAIIKFIN